MPFPRSGSIRRWSDGDYVVTTDPARVDLVGFARVFSDDVGFGSVADVFVLDGHRGHGIGVFVMQCVVESYDHLPRLVLGTRDAHGVYEKVGFEPLSRVERWMERWFSPPNP